jgi:hypothetical protein
MVRVVTDVRYCPLLPLAALCCRSSSTALLCITLGRLVYDLSQSVASCPTALGFIFRASCSYVNTLYCCIFRSLRRIIVSLLIPRLAPSTLHARINNTHRHTTRATQPHPATRPASHTHPFLYRNRARPHTQYAPVIAGIIARCHPYLPSTFFTRLVHYRRCCRSNALSTHDKSMLRHNYC